MVKKILKGNTFAILIISLIIVLFELNTSIWSAPLPAKGKKSPVANPVNAKKTFDHLVVGDIVHNLPDNYEIVIVDGQTYYYHDGIYYTLSTNSEYIVVEKPAVLPPTPAGSVAAAKHPAPAVSKGRPHKHP